eukprot:6641242-Lingulodinium_polyedra.AAC.1
MVPGTPHKRCKDTPRHRHILRPQHWEPAPNGKPLSPGRVRWRLNGRAGWLMRGRAIGVDLDG